MELQHWVLPITTLLLVLYTLARLGLELLNRQNVQRHSDEPPSELEGILEPDTYRKSVQYTLAKSRYTSWNILFDSVLLWVILFSGLLASTYQWVTQHWGNNPFPLAVWLAGMLILLGIPSLPWDWYYQFRLEERFGFNKSTLKTWVMDKIKGSLLSLLLGVPVLWLVLKILQWTGDAWWIWASGSLFGVQLIFLVLAPVLILPLFNKFTPLPDGPLKDRLLELGKKTGFHSQSLHVMDGSRRSSHSNAFFTGLGRWRKIVLFDTLIDQLDPSELEAVLAHEIGHYKKSHIPKLMALNAVNLTISFLILAWLIQQPWLYQGFGFSYQAGNLAPALLIFLLLSSAVIFWLSPLMNLWSRKHEYEADAYAKHTLGTEIPLLGALRKLNEKNLGNLNPHPLYSGFYYSHPTLMEREKALKMP